MRKLEELEAKIEASAKLDPNTKFRSDHGKFLVLSNV